MGIDSFQRSSARMSSNLLRFGAVNTTEIPGFPKADTEKIAAEIEKCEYHKNFEAILAPGSPFKARYDDKGVILEGWDYYPPKGDNDKIQGVCHELSYLLGERLKSIADSGGFTERYRFGVVLGNTLKYFSDPDSANHIYILAWREADDARVRREIQQNLALGNQKLPGNCMIIDPSFHRLYRSQDA